MEKIFLTAIISAVMTQLIAVDAASNCNGIQCNPNEYCSAFNDKCAKCSNICDIDTHNYHETDCQQYCPGYTYKDSIKDEIQKIKYQQDVLLILVSILVFVILISYVAKLYKWAKRNRHFSKFGIKYFKKKTEDKNQENQQIPKLNMSGISQINSRNGNDGSTILTVTTPISTRFPAEDSTTDFSYDNGGLQVTPIPDKPSPSGTHSTY